MGKPVLVGIIIYTKDTRTNSEQIYVGEIYFTLRGLILRSKQ